MSNRVLSNIIQCFYQQVDETPDAIAVEMNGKMLTYRALDILSTQFAKYLSDLAEVHGKSITLGYTAVCVNKSLEYVVGLLAVLKLKSAYVPIDPEFPAQRICHIINDCKANFILTNTVYSPRIHSYFKLNSEQDIPILVELDDLLLIESYTDERLLSPISEEDNAYVIYTSGSTGTPKGVVIQHAGVVNLATFEKKVFDLHQGKRVLGFSNVVFDAAVWEIFGCLLSGATLVLVDKKLLIPGQPLIDIIQDLAITHATLPPSTLNSTPYYAFSNLEVLISAGEACTINIQKKWGRGDFKFFNAYGPTESTVCASLIEIPAHSYSENIGIAIDNTNLYVLDESLNPSAPGEIGELYIGGVGLALKYLNQPQKTALYFLSDVLINGQMQRLYRTGDLVRVQNNGDIIFVGRKDTQVKYRGYRIEMGEIEAVLNADPDIEQAVLTYQDFGDRQEMVVYCRAHQATSSDLNNLLKKIISQSLPDYMMPKFFIPVESFPLNHNGKIDRTRLQELYSMKAQMTTSEEDNDDIDEITQKLKEIYQDILHRSVINVEDDFFDVGGHSLLLIQVIMLIKERLSVDLSINEFINNPKIVDLNKIIQQKCPLPEMRSEKKESLILSKDPVNRFEPFPLSDLQQGYYLGRNGYFELSDVSTNVYREFLFKDLDVSRLEESLNILIQRHDMLRCKIINAEQQQIMQDISHYVISVLDCRALDSTELKRHFAILRQELSIGKLPADTPPLICVKLSQTQEGYVLHITIDALIMDGWSYHLFFSEWSQVYHNLETDLPPLVCTYRDYVLFESTQKHVTQYDTDKAYWLERVASLPLGPSLPLLKSPKDLVHQAIPSKVTTLNASQWAVLKRKLKEVDLRPTSFLLSLFSEVMAYWSTSEHFTLCLTLFNRLPVDKQINDTIGVFSSLILLEVDYREKLRHLSFLERALHVQNQLFQDMNYRLFTGIEVQRAQRTKHAYAAIGTLVPVVFTSFLSAGEHSDHASLFPFSNRYYSSTQTSQIWLDAKAYEEQEQLIIEWDYIADLFPQGMMEDMFSAYEHLLHYFSENVSMLAKPLPHFSQNFITKSSSIQKQYVPNPENILLVQNYFDQVATQFPNHLAVISNAATLTYRELLHRSNQVANYLSELMKNQVQNVGIVMERGVEQVIAILGILKAGATYVPISPEFPPQRITQILSDARITTVLTQKRVYDTIMSLPNIQNFVVVDDPNDPLTQHVQTLNTHIHNTPDDLAYIIFTSGSTGKPKGVMISHRNVMNTILDINRRYHLSAQDRILSVSNLCFDLSVYDILGPLCVGGSVVMLDTLSEKDPRHWLTLIQNHQVTIWNSVPMFAQMLCQFLYEKQYEYSVKSIRLWLLSGDWIPLDLPEAIQACYTNCPTLKIVSLGGATECSIWSVIYDIGPIEKEWKSIPYGFGMSNQSIQILDKNLEFCPQYVVGDIYIGGLGISSGYLHDSEKTAKHFITHPTTRENLYRTGDLGRYMQDGAIEFLGRKDFQIKINGYRIELEEIQASLLQHPLVKNAHVISIKEENTQQKIVAFVLLHTSMEEKSSISTLHIFLQGLLPEYMLPHFYISLAEFKLTSNGKIDIDDLHKLAHLHNKKEETDLPQRDLNSSEKVLAEIWKKLLAVKHVTWNDDFFVLGGNSLTLIQLMLKVNEIFKIELQLPELIQSRKLFEQSVLIMRHQARTFLAVDTVGSL